jgi:putative DNA primase/helicase
MNAIPEELKRYPQWVATKVAPNPAKPDAKPRKPPINVHTGQGAIVTKPITLATYERVMDYLEEWQGHDHTHFSKEMGELTGPLIAPGFVLGADPYCFWDLDNCFDASGNLKPWARQKVDMLASYTEISLSGTGLHVLIRGAKPGKSCKKKMDEDGGELELYDHERYVALTGNVFEGRDTIEDRQAELEALYSQVFSTNGTGPERQR